MPPLLGSFLITLILELRHGANLYVFMSVGANVYV